MRFINSSILARVVAAFATILMVVVALGMISISRMRLAMSMNSRQTAV